MKKVLLLAVMALFVGAGAANACDGHAKASGTKASDKACATTTATGAKKASTEADKAACGTKTAGKGTPDCCAKKGAKMTEESAKTKATDKKS